MTETKHTAIRGESAEFPGLFQLAVDLHREEEGPGAFEGPAHRYRILLRDKAIRSGTIRAREPREAASLVRAYMHAALSRVPGTKIQVLDPVGDVVAERVCFMKTYEDGRTIPAWRDPSLHSDVPTEI